MLLPHYRRGVRPEATRPSPIRQAVYIPPAPPLWRKLAAEALAAVFMAVIVAGACVGIVFGLALLLTP